MPGLVSPPDSPPASPVQTVRGYPRWPAWYSSMAPYFTWNVPGCAAEYPGTNCVERAMLSGALRLARRGVCMTEQRDLILHIIRDAWLGAILCRNAGRDPDP